MRQAEGSWDWRACCAERTTAENDCRQQYSDCIDETSRSNWLFGLGPGSPAKFGRTGTNGVCQVVEPLSWPDWGNHDLYMGVTGALGALGFCNQGDAYVGTHSQICGGSRGTWGKTHMEVWRLADAPTPRRP